MIIYQGKIKEFIETVILGRIAEKIEEEFKVRKIQSNLRSEFRAWNNSLMYMQMVLNDSSINQELDVAIEYQIPSTSKRVDFIITGFDNANNKNGVIIELKQWESAERTSREDIVTTYVGGAIRAVTHPCYQAYSYAKTIENYSQYVEDNHVKMIPCAYLHNYTEEHRYQLDNELYSKIIKISPLFLKKDVLLLRKFIKKNVSNTDDGKILYGIENGKIRPSKALQDALSSMLKGNKEFYMIDEQKVVHSTILKLVELSEINNQKSTIIVEGGPGTGKSVLAIRLLVELREKIVNYVTKNAAPRNVYFAKLRRDKYKLSFIKSLFKGSGSFIDTKPNTYDCLLVDEAHRLNQKSGMFAHLGENQIKEIINASKVSVFFIDEDQIVTTKDFGSVEEIKKCAEKLGSKVYSGKDYILESQFRCNGSDGYIAFLDDILQIRDTANYDGFDLEYDIKVYDDPIQMRNDLRMKNLENNKARMVAGYCYNWVTKKNKSADVYDIELENGFKAKWNFDNTQTWAIDETSFEQVGCIHTSQGLEFDYIGVIIGNDLRYENNKVITDYTKRAKTDHSLKGVKKNGWYTLADRIIRNTYRTLLTRGQKGCYIYCEDNELSKYLEERLSNR
ncbi:DNA/RNA helicase domain-containing protein [Candidatus Izemoplasma sp. B36]|uniref:DNA/RNA helicase domain-containing protein n=1 Tax=Candidatus Izemoplasma sp. B36 TaxID=3242468 RepID=UPI0035587B17